MDNNALCVRFCVPLKREPQICFDLAFEFEQLFKETLCVLTLNYDAHPDILISLGCADCKIYSGLTTPERHPLLRLGAANMEFSSPRKKRVAEGLPVLYIFLLELGRTRTTAIR